MYKINLITMPFASLHMASIALTQLKSVIDTEFKDQVSVKIFYLNFDFAVYLGDKTFQDILAGKGYRTGLGDWFFRSIAFPQAADNTEEYFERYYPHSDKENVTLKKHILERQQGLDDFLQKLIRDYCLDDADMVGFTSLFAQTVSSFALAKKLKDQNPDIMMVLGGANCEAPMGLEMVKNVDYIDFVFSGPALKSFPQFVQYCMDGQIDHCDTIKGVFSKEKCASLQASGDCGSNQIGEEVHLDALNIDYDYDSYLDLFEKHFVTRETDEPPMLPFMTSTGCWWGERSMCTFCGLNSLTIDYKAMSPERAIKQFDNLFKYSDRCPHLFCVDNILPRNYVDEVFAKLNPPENTMIFYEVKANLTQDEMAALAKAKVKLMQPGIEALSTSLLKRMKKGATAFGNINFLKYCVMYDIFPIWNFLVGFPGQEEEIYPKYMEEIPLFAHLPPPNTAYPIRYDRYSPYFNFAQEYNLKLEPRDEYEYVYPFSKHSLKNLAYFFNDETANAEYIQTLNKWLPKIRGQVSAWLKRWYDASQTVAPRLFFKDKNVVYDSRNGVVIEHKISDAARLILDSIEKPLTLPVIASKLKNIPEVKNLRQSRRLEYVNRSKRTEICAT